MELTEDLNRLAPFGAGNPPIHLLTRNTKVVDDRLFGIKRQHRRVTVEDESGTLREFIWWRGSEAAAGKRESPRGRALALPEPDQAVCFGADG